MKLSGKRDLILATTILLVVAALLGFNYISHKKSAVIAQIIVDGKVAEILDLSRNTELTIASVNKGISHLIVRDGEIRCSEASYPDKVCMHRGKKHLGNNAIVRLPNKMIITIIGDE